MIDDETLLLVGSLSNDLMRVATLTQRGSLKGAQRFRVEAKRWAQQLRIRFGGVVQFFGGKGIGKILG